MATRKQAKKRAAVRSLEPKQTKLDTRLAASTRAPDAATPTLLNEMRRRMRPRTEDARVTRRIGMRDLGPRRPRPVTGGSAGQYAYLKMEMRVSSTIAERKGG